jgi:hypothetical protein
MLAFILERVLPNTQKGDLEARVYEILGQNTDNAWRLRIYLER